MKTIFIGFLLFCLAMPAMAQNKVEAFFRTESKFYVVVAVLAINMIGILVYILKLDKKISKIEKIIANKESQKVL